MKKILIALDYNPVAEQVAKAGYKLAKTMNAEVCLLHTLAEISYYGIQYPSFLGYEGYNTMNADLNLISDLRKIAEDFLQKAAEHLNDSTITTHLAEGETSSGILNYAEEWEADLIVMGTHSHSVLEKLLMGTVASKVLERTVIPVLMIPIPKD